MAPKVSVVMPSLNVEPYIRECMESVVNQSLKDLEIICVDAGSSDGTLEILNEYAAKDKRVTIIHSDKKSYGYQMNLGMDAAGGEYLAILETDDFILPKMYENLYRIAKNNSLDIIKSDYAQFTMENGVFTPINAAVAYDPEMYNHLIEDDPVLVLNRSFTCTWTGLYRLSFLREHNIRYNETPGASYQDNGFWFLTLAYAKRVWFYREAFYMLRRDNPNSSIRSKEKVNCIPDEYTYIREMLKRDPELYQRVIGVYWCALYNNFLWTYKRIGDEYKTEFAKLFSDTMKEGISKGEFDYKMVNAMQARNINRVANSYKRFERYMKSGNNRRESKGSYIERLIWCYEDNGFLYTIKHVADRIIKPHNS